MEYKVAILGKKEEIIAFKALGIETIFVADALSAENTLLEMRKEKTTKYAVIFIPEDIFQSISEEGIEKISQDVLPAIVPVPGLKGSTGFGEQRMRKFVEQAVGSDIFGDGG